MSAIRNFEESDPLLRLRIWAEQQNAETRKLVRTLVLVLDAQQAVIWRLTSEAGLSEESEVIEAVGQADQFLERLDADLGATSDVNAAVAPDGGPSVDDFLNRLSRHEVGNPSGDQTYISTDRSPRRRWTKEGSSKERLTTDEIFASDGTPLGRDPRKRRE